jgi:RNA polymerase sigma-70 factor (ECF subfamily)
MPHLTPSASALGGRAEPRADGVEAVDDRTRIADLYAAHGASVHRFLRDLLGDAVLAADATQETFVRAFKKLSELEPSARLVPWLFGIARNVSLELRKARFRAGRWVVPISGALPDAPATGPSPEASFLGREALEIVARALGELSEERRAMLLLRLDHGLSYDDIALTMGCSLAKVKVEIFRAREVLRAAIDGDTSDAQERQKGEKRGSP